MFHPALTLLLLVLTYVLLDAILQVHICSSQGVQTSNFTYRVALLMNDLLLDSRFKCKRLLINVIFLMFLQESQYLDTWLLLLHCSVRWLDNLLVAVLFPSYVHKMNLGVPCPIRVLPRTVITLMIHIPILSHLEP